VGGMINFRILIFSLILIGNPKLHAKVEAGSDEYYAGISNLEGLKSVTIVPMKAKSVLINDEEFSLKVMRTIKNLGITYSGTGNGTFYMLATDVAITMPKDGSHLILYSIHMSVEREFRNPEIRLKKSWAVVWHCDMDGFAGETAFDGAFRDAFDDVLNKFEFDYNKANL
jgi:hypothetical protein